MEMKHSLSQTQRMTQTLQMTPLMIAALELLQMSTLELEQRIKEEVEANPLLELQDDDGDDAPAPTGDAEGDADPDATRVPVEQTPPTEESERERDAANDDADWTEYLGDDLEAPSFAGEYDASAEFHERVPVATMGLADHLTSQLRFAESDERRLEIGEYMIGCIDDRGYLTSSIAEVAAELGASEDDVESLLRVIQSFEPPGVGARDLPECLLIQLAIANESESLAARIIRERFAELSDRRYPDIARSLKVSVADVQAAADHIARLNPKPGFAYASEEPKYVTPDLVVERIGERYVVLVNDRNLPRLRISSTYESVLRDRERANAPTRDFVKERLSSARWLINTIEQRRKTMVRVMECIVEMQHDFFEKGIQALKPLTLAQVATVVEVHESTVSRVTKSKYVQTPRGVFELKFFFSGGLSTDDGTDVSAKAVKQEIAQMVAAEDPHQPLSDQQIADTLKRKGLNIARRTVAKYRDQLLIQPARQRRRYDSPAAAAAALGDESED